jgi:hypothetical protein
MQLTIRPLTPDLWPALEDLFRKGGASNGCWCMYWRIGGEYHKREREKNRRAFHEIVKHGLRCGMICLGSIARDFSSAWTNCRSGLSRAFTCGAAVADRVSCRL